MEKKHLIRALMFCLTIISISTPSFAEWKNIARLDQPIPRPRTQCTYRLAYDTFSAQVQSSIHFYLSVDNEGRFSDGYLIKSMGFQVGAGDAQTLGGSGGLINGLQDYYNILDVLSTHNTGATALSRTLLIVNIGYPPRGAGGVAQANFYVELVSPTVTYNENFPLDPAKFRLEQDCR